MHVELTARGTAYQPNLFEPEPIKDKDITMFWIDIRSFYARVLENENPSLANRPFIIVNGGFIAAKNTAAKEKYPELSNYKYINQVPMELKKRVNVLTYDGKEWKEQYKKFRDASQLVFVEIYNGMNEYLKNQSINSEPIGFSLSKAHIDDFCIGATIDLTSSQEGQSSGKEQSTSIAKYLLKICADAGYPARCGISMTDSYAWTACHLAKDKGLESIILDWDIVKEMLFDKNVDSLYNVGARTAESLKSQKMATISDIFNSKQGTLANLGVDGEKIEERVKGFHDIKLRQGLSNSKKERVVKVI